MESRKPKIDQPLQQALDGLMDQAEIDVLLYPTQMREEFKQFLQTKKNEGLLDYNILQMANCVVIKAPKKVILELADRDDVSRITINPKFTMH